MRSVTCSSSSSSSSSVFECETAEGCVTLCGMCPSCVLAPGPPGSTRCLWKVSDDFRRRFIVGLLLRCTNIQVLESVQNMLEATSWTLLTYARSRRPTQDHMNHMNHNNHHLQHLHHRDVDRKPLGTDVTEIWSWFSDSPDWMKSSYLCRLFSHCDSELLRVVSNLTSVLLVRQKRGLLQINLKKGNKTSAQAGDGDSEDPALMVVPGSSKSVSGVSRYRDFISCLPVDLSKRILGLLGENTLRCCLRVCQYWCHLATETMEEMKLRKYFQDQMTTMMMKCKGIKPVSSTYANIVEVNVPTNPYEQEEEIHSSVQKVAPFKDAYANIRTRAVAMEERNVYCGAYFTKVLLSKEDPRRVLDYRGRSFMALGTKDRTVHLFYVASETKAVSVMKGHVGRIRAVRVHEDRNMVITAGCDASIRCWNLKTDRCEMVLYGHNSTINCLDVHNDTLVSGSKDCSIKVWNLQTGKQFEDFNFKHSSCILCVKINSTKVFSSCNRGLVKIWDIETASLLRVIDAHKSPVKCLFFDEWHLLSADVSGQVVAWSLCCHVKDHLMTFNHPKEVKSLTLAFLRVVTGCADGKIRVFNFLTGDCLREITAETESHRILSVHFHDKRLLVNTTSNVKLYQFAKVFWDYTELAETGQGDGDMSARGGLVSEKSAASLRKLPGANDMMTQVVVPTRKIHQRDGKKPGRAEEPHHTRFLFTPTKCRTQVREHCEVTKLVQSEKAACAQMKKRGLHHPLTRDFILLSVSAVQRAQFPDEVSVNMECNARLRDSWGPSHSGVQDLKESLQTQTGPPWYVCDDRPVRAKTCIPVLKREDVSQNMMSTDVTDMKKHRCLSSKKAKPHSADTTQRVRSSWSL